MSNVDTVFCQPPKIHTLIGAGTFRLAERSRPRQAHTGLAVEALRASVSCGPRAVLTRPAVQVLSRADAVRMWVWVYAAIARMTGWADRWCACSASNGCPFVTTAQAICSNFRAAAHRATFIGLPAARNRS